MNEWESKIRISIHSLIKLFKYRPWGKAVDPMIVYILDGTNYMGGLADRIRQILGVYAICKYKGYKFGLIANDPFELRDYLLPNYNWLVTSENFSRNIFHSSPIYLGYRSKGKYISLLTLKNRQLHLYASVHWGFVFDFGYSINELFRELFDPIPEIKKFIETMKNKYHIWEALVFRFQNLLGDFNEPLYAQKSKVNLSDDEKIGLSEKCLKYIYSQSKEARNYILVCSDSLSFLDKVKAIPGIFVVPGMLTHMEYTRDKDFLLHLKSFLDLFMISESISVKSVGTDIMYQSDFPALAASINNVPFERVTIS